MTWIRTVAEGEATGRLARIYEEALARAGRVFAILRAMSIAPRTLESSMAFYRTIMFARDGLGRRRREMIATVVSRANDCHY
jgi:uncharacterized peroxidase-related enzyme